MYSLEYGTPQRVEWSHFIIYFEFQEKIYDDVHLIVADDVMTKLMLVLHPLFLPPLLQ